MLLLLIHLIDQPTRPLQPPSLVDNAWSWSNVASVETSQIKSAQLQALTWFIHSWFNVPPQYNITQHRTIPRHPAIFPWSSGP